MPWLDSVMSWFPRGTGGSTVVGASVRTDHHRHAAALTLSSSDSHIRAAADSALLLHGVHSLWNTVETVLNRHDVDPSENEMAAVISFATEVASSLECQNATAHTQLTDFLLLVDAMSKLLSWSTRFSSTLSTDARDRLALQQLRIYDLLLGQSERCLLTEKSLILPLLRVLISCGTSTNSSVEDQLALVLHQLCVGVSRFPAALELLFDTFSSSTKSDTSGSTKSSQFLVFSLLIPYVHREGLIAQQARDDLLLIMSLSSSQDNIGRHIVDKSDFCPVSRRLCLFFSTKFVVTMT